MPYASASQPCALPGSHRATEARATWGSCRQEGAETKQKAGSGSKRLLFPFPAEGDAHRNISVLFSPAVNTYLFMMQAQGIMIRENMRTIGAQVYEQVVRSAYAKRNSSVNDSGISRIIVILIKDCISIGK